MNFEVDFFFFWGGGACVNDLHLHPHICSSSLNLKIKAGKILIDTFINLFFHHLFLLRSWVTFSGHSLLVSYSCLTFRRVSSLSWSCLFSSVLRFQPCRCSLRPLCLQWATFPPVTPSLLSHTFPFLLCTSFTFLHLALTADSFSTLVLAQVLASTYARPPPLSYLHLDHPLMSSLPPMPPLICKTADARFLCCDYECGFMFSLPVFSSHDLPWHLSMISFSTNERKRKRGFRVYLLTFVFMLTVWSL